MRIARDCLQEGHFAVIANRGEERGQDGEQIAHLLQRDAPPMPMVGKPAIAAALADLLEARTADIPEAHIADIPGGRIAGAPL
jgi:phosphopantothenoylcysteine decarboxylase/phosphopantothenate--cysteine ligase